MQSQTSRRPHAAGTLPCLILLLPTSLPPSRACVHADQDLYELGTTMRGRYIADRFFEEYNKELKKVRVA